MNYVLAEGKLGKDPITRVTQNGKMVASFSMATSEKIGEKEQTEWLNIVAWGKLAEKCDSLQKGSTVVVQGRISTRSYDAKDGTKRYVTEIVANKLMPIDKLKSTPITSADQFGSSVDEDIPY